MEKKIGELFGDELIVAVFAQVPPGSTFKLEDESELITAFYSASRNAEYSPLFANYPFDTDGIAPYCRALADGFSSLQQSRMLSRQNPDLVEYTVSDEFKIRYDMFILPKISGLVELVKKLAREVNDCLMPA